MIELESLHVPRTAGATFLQVLRHWYGEGNVGTSDGVRADAVGFGTRAMHGQFPAGTYRARKRVAWVRDPALRLLSQYFGLRHQQPSRPSTPGYDLHVGVQSGLVSIEEFVHHPSMHRGIAKWFDGTTLDDFDFVGIQEHFERELGRCAHVLDQPAVTIGGGENITVSTDYEAFKQQVTPALLAEIRALHADCTALYDDARTRAEAWWAVRSEPSLPIHDEARRRAEAVAWWEAQQEVQQERQPSYAPGATTTAAPLSAAAITA